MSSDAASSTRFDYRNHAWAGFALALAGAAFFATKGIVIKLALAEGIDPVTTLTWRMIVAVPIFLTVGIITYRRKLAATPAGAPPALTLPVLAQTLGVGVIGYYVASYLDFAALGYISAQLDRLILLTYPFFVVLFGAVFFRRRITGPMAGALVVSYAGIAMIFAHDMAIEGDDVLLGAGLVFGSAVAYAAYQIMAKPLIDRLGAELFTSIAMSAAGPAVVTHFLATHPVGALAVTGNGFLLMLAIGTISTVVPAYCISGAIGLIGPERTAIIGNISPLVTVGLAIFILGEAFTPWHALGTVLVLGGVWLFTRREKPKVKVLEESTA
ncbi:MAG: DMT family transporter [Devosia sp.]|uniref:DMT family transporter n=1 Tax=Devosia sp. TaxID=1871048 RepID=UPI001AD21896|nr:DMT family transporter [Devosia sp.]MBN9310686.1 DMT family transporter [Devosia sp.]MBN9317057.1 DMT family transporter [Devosia sp.]